MHVRGFKEAGTTTTPFDMTVLNDLDRFHLADDVIARLPHLLPEAGETREFLSVKLAEHKAWIREYGKDMPEIQEWQWCALLRDDRFMHAQGGALSCGRLSAG